jgi:galactokinase
VSGDPLDQGRANPGRAKPGHADPGHADPGRASPSAVPASDPLDPARLRAALEARDERARAAPSAIRVVRAPGRVNLIGEHTDYNDGFVMPAAIGLEIRIAYVPTDDHRVEVTLDDTGRTVGFDLRAIGPATGRWIDYVAGTAWAMTAAGASVRGFRGLLSSSLPRGAGLSSSAALELASAWALAGDAPPALDGLTLARAAQHAENDYVGVHSGLMDQFASSLGVAGAGLFLDCRSLEWHSVSLPLAEIAVVVCNSGSPRRLERSAYNDRRAECERAAATIARREHGVRSLRDVDPDMLARNRDALDPIAERRARHVIEENVRVIAAERALATGDLDQVGRLFAASHDSLRDLFEVSSPELDALVGIAGETEGVVAARLTGAGFGGCTINLVRRDRTAAFRAAVERDYPARTGLRPTVYEVEPVDGAGLVE